MSKTPMSQSRSRPRNRRARDVLATLDETVRHILAGADSPHVVVGPLVWQPSDGTSARRWYFTVATSEPGRGFRCDQVCAGDHSDRAAVIMALAATRPPLVIHDMDSELGMAQLSETLWPGERISSLRAAVEAEYAEARQAEVRNV